MAGQVATILRIASDQFGNYFLGNPALQPVAFHQLANDMFCIRGTAAVATGQHCVATPKTIAPGLPVVRILRIWIGPLRLGNLKPRQWRYLTMQEVSELKGNEVGKRIRHPQKK